MNDIWRSQTEGDPYYEPYDRARRDRRRARLIALERGYAAVIGLVVIIVASFWAGISLGKIRDEICHQQAAAMAAQRPLP